MIKKDTIFSERLIGSENVSHKEIDFVNASTERDTELFLDPVLIDMGKSDFCLRAKDKVDDFFHYLFCAYVKNDIKEKKRILKRAREINDTHLGYGFKFGKGNTADGLIEIFTGIDEYLNHVKKVKAFDFVLFTPNFAEDGMSDLLTNILYKELSEFTLSQCNKYGIPKAKTKETRFYWDKDKHEWLKYEGESLIINQKIVLLVPKEVVSLKYHFSLDNYLRKVIVENICEAKATYDETGKKVRPYKTEIRDALIEEKCGLYEAVCECSKKNPSLIDVYNSNIAAISNTEPMSDDELDAVTMR